MKTSKAGLDLIKHFEGLHDGDLKKIGLQPKKCPAGIWTQGYGSAMRDAKGRFLKGNVMPNVTISELEAECLLLKDLSKFEVIVARKVTVPLTQNQFDALVSHTYNTGGSNTLFRLINKNAPINDIRAWFEKKYITSNGKILKGLIKRRKSESKLFFKNV